MSTFDQAFDVVVGHEGGFDRTSADPGNWTGGRVGSGELRGTKYGISAAAYPSTDIADLTMADARAIYQRNYWNRIDADSLPAAVALVVFDAAVNNGAVRATEWLQGVVGADVDGWIGDHTIAAVTSYVAENSVSALCAEFLAQRFVFMAGLATWPTFGLGWARRLTMLPFQAAGFEAPVS